MNRRQQQPTPGRSFDATMAAHLDDLRQRAISRRGLVRVAAGGAALAAAAGVAPKPFLPGLSVLAQENGTLVFALEGDVRGLEPALAYDFTANPVVCQISEGLMMFDTEGGIQPLLAESYDHPDPLTYVYTIRSGITFHDGTELTIEDVIASIERVRDPEVAGPMAWMYDPVESIEQTGEGTLTITLSEPSALFAFVPATTAGHVISRAAITEFGPDLLRNPVGTGPYRFVNWASGSEIELEKNPDYWQEGMPFFDRLVFKIVEEGTTRVTGLKNGDINLMTQVPPDQIDAVTQFENVNWQEVVGYTINLVTMRTDQPPFDDPKVRQAVAHAIPYADIMDNIVKTTGVRAQQTTVPSNMPGSAEGQLEPVEYDLERAQQLLAESSQPDGFATKYHLIAPNEIWVPQAIAVQEALKELNIELEIVQMPYADMITLQQAGDYEGMMSFQWGSDFPDASGMLLPLFHSRNFPPQNNHAYYQNARVDELLDTQEGEQDPERRQQMLVEIQQLIAADQPAIFFEHFKWFMPMTNTLEGYEVQPLWYWDAFARTLKPTSA